MGDFNKNVKQTVGELDCYFSTPPPVQYMWLDCKTKISDTMTLKLSNQYNQQYHEIALENEHV